MVFATQYTLQSCHRSQYIRPLFPCILYIFAPLTTLTLDTHVRMCVLCRCVDVVITVCSAASTAACTHLCTLTRRRAHVVVAVVAAAVPTLAKTGTRCSVSVKSNRIYYVHMYVRTVGVFCMTCRQGSGEFCRYVV